MKTLRQAAAIAMASAILGGCAQFTGSEEVTLDGDPITNDGDGLAVGVSPPTKSFGCAYPINANPGVAQGQMVPGHVSWQGYVAGEEAPRVFAITEAYDCTGDEIHAIGVDTSQFG
jgi:hypothetical protein